MEKAKDEARLRFMKRELNKIIGLRIKRAREGVGLTQEALAERVDRTKEAVSNIERGINLPSLDTLQRICEVVEMPITTILEESNRSQSFIDTKAQIDAVLMTMGEDELRFCLSIVKLVASRRTGTENEDGDQ